MDNTYFNELKAQIKNDIKNSEPNNSFERYGEEIKRVALGHNYDREMITDLLEGIIASGVSLDQQSNAWTKRRNVKINVFLGNNHFERFLKEYLTSDNTYTNAPDSLRASQLDEQKLEAMFDILSVLNTKLVGVAKDTLAKFLIDNVFHNFFKTDKKKDEEVDQRQGFMGDAQSLLYEENTYLCLYKTLEFFELNKTQITPDLHNQIETNVAEFLLVYWCMDFDIDGVPQDKARLGEATCSLYVDQILKNEALEINKFKNVLQKYAAKENTDGAEIAMGLLGTFLDKKMLECEIGRKNKVGEHKTFKV